MQADSAATAMVTTVTITQPKSSVPRVTLKVLTRLWTRYGAAANGAKSAKTATASKKPKKPKTAKNYPNSNDYFAI